MLQLIPNAKTLNPNRISKIQQGNNNLRDNIILNEFIDNPILIYHVEDNILGLDIDSVIHFLNQYETEEVILIDNTVYTSYIDILLNVEVKVNSLEEITILQPEQILDFVYETDFDKVVYVRSQIRDAYEFTMLASTYASLLDVPLIIEDSYYDSSEYLENKEVILIGSGLNCPQNSICTEQYNTIQELQQQYLDISSTDKIILVNPNDINNNFAINEQINVEELTPELNTGTIHDLYYKTSLSAPILAKAKEELILFFDHPSTFNIVNCSYPIKPQFAEELGVLRDAVKNQYETLNFPNSIHYLTIIAAPNAITDSVDVAAYNCEGEPIRKLATDRRIINSTTYPNLKVGRIYSLTSSDVSAYINRAIYYDELFENIYGNDELTFQTINGRVVNGAPNTIETEDIYYLIFNALLRLVAENKGYTTEKAIFSYGDDFRFPIGYPPELSNAIEAEYTSVNNSILNQTEGLTLPNEDQIINSISDNYQETHYIKFPDGSGFDYDYDPLSEKQIIVTIAHGNVKGYAEFLTSEILPELNLAYFLAPSCTTNFFWQRTRQSTGEIIPRHLHFGANVLRKGGIAAQGLITQGQGEIMFTQTLMLLDVLNKDNVELGEFNNILEDFNIMIEYESGQGPDRNAALQFTMLGDPTVVLKMN